MIEIVGSKGKCDNSRPDAGGHRVLKRPISVSEKDGHGPLRTGARVALSCNSDVELSITIEISSDNPDGRRPFDRVDHGRLKGAVSIAEQDTYRRRIATRY